MSGALAVEASGLTKRYRNQVAVDGIDLAIPGGEICGLLGPNGAGKTTTILMLMGLTEPSAGKISVLGCDPLRDPLAVKRRVGYLPDSVGFYEQLTGRQNLRYTARLAGLEGEEMEHRIAMALHKVRLEAPADRRVGGYSHGMRQRLGLAEVFMKGVRLAILDEPTSGLDPQSTAELLDLILDLKAEGVAILLSSHLLNRVQAVCDRVLLFHSGKIALRGTVAELSRQVLGGGYSIEVTARGVDFPALMKQVPGARSVVGVGNQSYRIAAESDLRPLIAEAVIGAGGALFRLSVVEPSLDDIYTRYFKSQAANANRAA
jgi:ABC-2 type transport system ATP-binding protein